MIFAKRGSRKHEDRIRAVRFNGFDRLFTGHGNKWVFPDWLPPIIQQVIDMQGAYDDAYAETLDEVPVGDAWRFGPHLMIGTVFGRKVAKRGDYVVLRNGGLLDVMTQAELRSQYRMMT